MQIQTNNANASALLKWEATSANKTSSGTFLITTDQGASVNNVSLTGTASGLLSSDMANHAIQATQASDTKHYIAQPFAYMTDSDKKLIEAATGWTIGSDNKFRDKNGNPVQGQGLSNHSLDLMMMNIQGARVAQSQGISIPSVGNPITAQQFSDMAVKWKANAASMGETFNASLLSNGLAYLNGRDGTNQATPTNSDASTNQISQADQEYLQKIANDPNFASKQAKLLSTGQDGLLIPDTFFPPSPELLSKMHALNDPSNPVQQVMSQRQNLYQNLVNQGVTPAQIYSDLLKFNVNLPSSYSDALDPTNSYPKGYWAQTQQTQLNYLQQAIGSQPSS